MKSIYIYLFWTLPNFTQNYLQKKQFTAVPMFNTLRSQQGRLMVEGGRSVGQWL